MPNLKGGRAFMPDTSDGDPQAPPEIVCDLAPDRRRPGGGGAIGAATGGAT